MNMVMRAYQISFQHTAARRRLDISEFFSGFTHKSFNTQPPEGGWAILAIDRCGAGGFNTQPPEGGWL